MARAKFVEVITKDGRKHQYNSVQEVVNNSEFALWYILRNIKCKKYEDLMNKVKRVTVDDIVRYEC